MLYANKVALANSARLSMLELRHLELDLYTNNARNIAIKAVLIGAIGWSALIYTKKDYYQLADPVFLHLYPIACMVNVAYSLLTVVQFNLIALMAPGLALRGPDGSVHLAVEGMMIEYRRATHFFGMSVLWTFLILLTYSWCGAAYRPLYNKIVLTALSVGSAYIILAQSRTVARQFSSPTVYTGSFYPHETLSNPPREGSAVRDPEERAAARKPRRKHFLGPMW
jgi:hypothetical protein